MKKLNTKPCPFCGGSFAAYICDDEGNRKNEDYLDDPWSGVSFEIVHTTELGAHADCPMRDMYGVSYDTLEEAEEWLNKRSLKDTSDSLDDRPMGGFKDI